MAAEDAKFREVQARSAADQIEGEWSILVHDCPLPARPEIEVNKVAAGSVWTCKCGENWKLAVQRRTRDDDPTLQFVRMSGDKD